MKTSRNSPCPCGSGRKHKRCCGAAEREALARARREGAVGDRILSWSPSELGEDLQAAIDEFTGGTREFTDDADLQLFSSWFHNDRELADGRTPAELYAMRPEIDAAERETARRIAASRLGLHRVTDVVAGESLELVDLLGGGSCRVRSDNVSTEAARWDVLLTRVMPGEPASLWGPARFFSAAEERELLEELARLAAERGEPAGDDGMRAALLAEPLAMIQFRTPSSVAERSFWTLEGHPVAEARVSWRLVDPGQARERLAGFGGCKPDEDPLEVEITSSREALIAERGGKELPLGAIVLESSPIGDGDLAPVATVRIEGDRLSAEALSEPRLEGVIATVEEDFGDLLAEREQQVVAIEDRLAAMPEPDEDAGREDEPLDPEEQEIIGETLRERYRSWLDEPNPRLGGATPREAVAANRGAEVVPLVRAVENGAARSAREHGGDAELDLLGELGLGEDQAA